MATQQQQPRVGYDDTPFIPGQKYRVHDSTRPQPRVVTPGTESTQERAGRPPSDAVILFDGTDLSGWVANPRSGSSDGPARWKVENGYMEVVPRSGGIRTREEFGDCQVHLEWAAPAEVVGNSQGRGNSGVFLMNRYEIQVLDCYDNPTYADGTTAAVYGQHPPLVNACRKPGEWQTYDIIWTAPRFDGERLVSPAYVTMFHNGVLVHNHREVLGPTAHRKVTPYEPHPPVGPLSLQDHGNPMRFRNIWYRPLNLHGQA
ncbi:MAG: DUF1080 domain-containing protein [Chloroflexi bacterium]|nr:DUF1080 domain-containing protein [Chloroflexota bacterium]